MDKFEIIVYNDMKLVRDSMAKLERSISDLKAEFNRTAKQITEYEAVTKQLKEAEEKLAKISSFVGGGNV